MISTGELAGRTRSGGGTGVATSDELLEHGRGGVRFFERFLPRYEAWTGRTLGGGMQGIASTYDEVGGIRFDKLRADVDRLGQVHSDLTDRNDQLAGNVTSLRGVWDGDAATEADGYGTSFLREAANVADGVDVAQTLISMSADRAESAVLTRAQLVSGLDSHHVGGLTPHQIDQVIAAARGNAAPVQLFEMVMLAAFAPADDVPAFTEEQSFTGMLDSASAWMGQRGKQWLDEVFVPSVEASYQAFQQYTSITTQDVSDSWTGMTDGVGSLDPQQPAGGTAPAGAPGAVQAPVSTTPDDSATSFPGGTSPGAAAPGAVPDQAPVQVTTPTATLPPSTTDTASPIGSALSNTGAPAEAGDAQLAHAPDLDDGQVGRIGNGLSLSKPDEDGRAQLTVQHPDGSVVQYPVDLGAMNSGSAGQGVSGADGTATVHDGSTTITLHRPASGGPVAVTVDDGSGDPQSYTVDFGDETPSGAGDASLASNTPNLLQHNASGGGASMALGGGGGGGGADGAAGAGLGHLGGGGGGGAGAPATAAPTPQPGSFSGVGAPSQLPAAAAAAGAAGVAGAAVANGGGGMGGGMMPMMGGMGGGRGGDQERGGRYGTTEDFFGEDVSSFKRIKDMLEPELPE